MKRILLLLSSVIYFLTANAQIIANDSVELGAGSQNRVFYSLATGQKTAASNTNWHMAITVRPAAYPTSPLGGTTMRMNEANGVKVYYVPNASAAQFSAVDTTGYHSWGTLHDADTSIDEGVLNSNRNRTNQFDFGWGLYNSSIHNVIGDSLYLIQLPTGELKKFLVVILKKDTAFDLKYSNIDNSDSQTIHISKVDNSGKEFMYLNLADNTVTDVEPHQADWDLEFLKYAATDVLANKYVAETGVWLNKGAEAARRANHDVADNDYSGLTFSSHLNTIGWNWKYPVNLNALLSGKNISQSLEYYLTQDSLAYFVRTKSGEVYKIVFTKYDVSNGRICFYKEKLASTGISETQENVFSIFPNPANSILNVVLSTSSAALKVFDISGRMITETVTSENIIQLNTSEFANGVYLLQINANGKTSVNRFVVNK